MTEFECFDFCLFWAIGFFFPLGNATLLLSKKSYLYLDGPNWEWPVTIALARLTNRTLHMQGTTKLSVCVFSILSFCMWLPVPWVVVLQWHCFRLNPECHREGFEEFPGWLGNRFPYWPPLLLQFQRGNPCPGQDLSMRRYCNYSVPRVSGAAQLLSALTLPPDVVPDLQKGRGTGRKMFLLKHSDSGCLKVLFAVSCCSSRSVK